MGLAQDLECVGFEPRNVAVVPGQCPPGGELALRCGALAKMVAHTQVRGVAQVKVFQGEFTPQQQADPGVLLTLRKQNRPRRGALQSHLGL